MKEVISVVVFGALTGAGMLLGECVMKKSLENIRSLTNAIKNKKALSK